MKEKRDGASVTYGIAIGTFYSHIKEGIRGFAESSGISEEDITTWIIVLLSSDSGREILRSKDRMPGPNLFKKTTESPKRRSKVAVAEQSSRTTPAKKNKISPWAKFNTPLKRRREMARRLAMRQKKAA